MNQPARHPKYGTQKRQKLNRPLDSREPKDFRAGLKVKIKSLAEEARIIRKAEQDTGSLEIYDRLRTHRLATVRREARAAQLAYGFIRGRRSCEIERPSPEKQRAAKGKRRQGSGFPNMRNIAKMVLQYGPGCGLFGAIGLDRKTAEVADWYRDLT